MTPYEERLAQLRAKQLSAAQVENMSEEAREILKLMSDDTKELALDDEDALGLLQDRLALSQYFKSASYTPGEAPKAGWNDEAKRPQDKLTLFAYGELGEEPCAFKVQIVAVGVSIGVYYSRMTAANGGNMRAAAEPVDLG